MAKKVVKKTKITKDTIFENEHTTGDNFLEVPMTPEEILHGVTEDQKQIIEDVSATLIIPPLPTSPDWQDYVISQFAENEMFEGRPMLHGLRRVSELLIGEIISCKTNVVQCPHPDNEKRATVICSICFLRDNLIKEFQGSGDSFWGNTDKEFRHYPVSIAESRAQARAFRSALKLKQIAAEEVSQVALEENPVNPYEDNDLITQNQINFIDILSSSNGRGLNISVEKLIHNKYAQCTNIKTLKHTEALVIIEDLSTYQKDMSLIPEDIKGYHSDWKESFAN